MNKLEALGWSAFFQKQLIEPLCDSHAVGRVVEVQREMACVRTARSDSWCSLGGRLRHETVELSELPAVGDWVIVRAAPGADRGVVDRILRRKSAFCRRAPETGGEQVIAANIDIALIVSALNADHNVRRIERYLALVWESGARPAVLLSKADLCDDVDGAIGDVESIAPGVAVRAVSAQSGAGVEEIRALIRPGETAVLLGSSGVGKSTLVNVLLGEQVQYVSQLSGHKDKGRHTTTARRMLTIAGGGIIIDTPGLREIGLTDAESGVAQTFEDIQQITLSCRFTDCRHDSEPGCAIRQALQSGRLDPARYRSYLKLQREAAYEARQADANLARIEKERWRKIHAMNKKRPKRWEM